MQRVGLYAWGGPGTVRLLKTKYHAPRIDEASFMNLYEPHFLQQAKQKLGVTDMWVTYSWGFSDTTERQDRQFILDRLPHFHANDIATHAYIQGLNLVTDEFANADVFCRDSKGRLLPYSKGRALTCPNNPHARQIILDRVAEACRGEFDGVFMDNVMFGLPPFLIRSDHTSFFGCSCAHCQARFQADYGYGLPLSAKVGQQQIADYLNFRSQSVMTLVRDLADICRAAGKQFGVNLYDPYWYASDFYFGYRLAEISAALDYYLIENLALRNGNHHLAPMLAAARQPVFVVSYREGIGRDAAYPQHVIDAIWSEAAAMGYAPCLKATEYITRGVWHALDIDAVRPPQIRPLQRAVSTHSLSSLKASSRWERGLVRLMDGRYPLFATAAYENRYLARLLDRLGFATRLMHVQRNFTASSGMLLAD
ncbi:MAG: putative glycoside hydrolase family 15 protein [Anaerolineae bacterium]|nr:putative glycoside hydrolase family 15 protein [Anaerolineae bacterium]